MRHVNAKHASSTCRNQPNMSVRASLLQCKLDHCAPFCSMVSDLFKKEVGMLKVFALSLNCVL